MTYWLPLVPHGAITTQRTMRLTITRQSEIAAVVRVVDALPPQCTDARIAATDV